MSIKVTELSKHGTTNPIVARLHVQTSELIQFAKLPAEASEILFQSYFDLGLKLLDCWDISEKIRLEVNDIVKNFVVARNDIGINVPYMQSIKTDAHHFLYIAKNFLRDLTGVVNIFFGTSFNEASNFSETMKPKNFIRGWLSQNSKEDEALIALLQRSEAGITAIIKKRNAVEHPRGKSGVLYVHNFEHKGGGFNLPSWNLNDNPREDISKELGKVTEELLIFSEELLITALSRRLVMANLFFLEIPAEHRDPTCPKRFFVQIASEIKA